MARRRARAPGRSRTRYARDDDWYEWKPYVPVAERHAQAVREARTLARNGRELAPVALRGRTIAETFWGKAWCENLERYRDFENRLPRGRTYVRNGSVIDLQIGAGLVEALVSGTSLYTVRVTVGPVSADRWQAICRDCTGGIDSLVELLQGTFSTAVMERMCRKGDGLFPAPREIRFECSCPDWAVMCKHVAAVLYGVGARLDTRPELLFRLRQVDERQLLASADQLPLSRKQPASSRILSTLDLADVFGPDIVVVEDVPPRPAPAARKKRGGRS